MSTELSGQNIKENLEAIRNRISQAEKKSGRAPGSVKLMAVSKFHPAEAVINAFEAGQLLFGENRVQEASEKFSPIINQHPEIKVQMIGQLQSNKVKKAIEFASCIQSVDRIDLLKEIEKQCAKQNRTIDILFEIHTGEESKSGYTSEQELIESIETCIKGDFPHITPKGFMTMAPFTDDEKAVRKSFITLRELAEKLRSTYLTLSLNELSMGMSGDFEIAIEEGSTLVRVGTAIFGERDYTK
ncbi:MAG: YggS family pyridoxal phosphate-dependent enzyme [Treponema sp.]|nr:YggS family pyridoxal phosphate-dependent enzyme [Treponema sp.]